MAHLHPESEYCGASYGGGISLEQQHVRLRSLSFQHTTLAVNRRYIEKNRATALKVLKAYVSSIERIKADKQFSLKVVSKYMRTTDPEVLESTYNVAFPLFKTPPYPTLAGIQATFDFMAEKDPKTKQAQPKDFVDISLLEEIERTGAPEKRKN